MQRAWGANELRPVSGTPDDSLYRGVRMGATVLDAADTLMIMGMDDEYKQCRAWIQDNLRYIYVGVGLFKVQGDFFYKAQCRAAISLPLSFSLGPCVCVCGCGCVGVGVGVPWGRRFWMRPIHSRLWGMDDEYKQCRAWIQDNLRCLCVCVWACVCVCSSVVRVCVCMCARMECVSSHVGTFSSSDAVLSPC